MSAAASVGRGREDSAWDVPAYRLFLLARSVALVGNALTLVAMPVLVYRLTGSAALTAAMTAVETLPYLVVGLPAGALVDRWHRRRVMVVTAVGSGLAMATVPLAQALDALTFPHLLAVGATLATLFVFSDAASFGVVPQMVGRARVASATSTLVSVGTAIALVGPAVAGVLVTVVDPAWVLGVDAAAYLLSAAVLARLRWPGSEDRRASAPGSGDTPADLAADGPGPSLRREIGEGLRHLWQQPVVRRLTLLGIGASLAGGATTGLLVVVGVEQLGLADDAPQLGWLYSAAAAGTFVASLALPRLQRRLGVGVITTGGFALALVMLLALSWSASLAPALVAVALFHLATTSLIVNGIVTRQVLTPEPLQSRVNTTARLIAWGGSPLGATLGGVLAEVAGTGWALRLAAVGLAASLLGALLTGLLAVPRLADLEAPDD